MSDSIFISAGEASGEHYGALLVEELQKRLAAAGQTAQFFGMGGTRMQAAGLERIVRSEDVAVMGLTEVIRHLPRIYGEFRRLKQAIRERRPSVAVLIDFPEIHFHLAEQLHELGIPVIFFVSPQLWAWKKHRIKLVHKYIDRMLVIFPFEEQFYRKQGVAAEFVGHPLAELPLPTIGRAQFAAENGLDPDKTWIGLLPGSRPKEIRDILPEILLAARLLKTPVFHPDEMDPSLGTPVLKGHDFSRAAEGLNADPDLAAEGMPTIEDESPRGLKPRPSKEFEFLIPLAPTLNAAQRNDVQQLVATHGQGLAIRLVNDARATLFYVRASVVASGTATVEAALIGNPFVVVYRVSPLTFAIAKRVVKVDHVAMVNLIAGKRAVPELIQNDFTAANIVQQIGPLLPDGAPRQSMMQELKRVQTLLGARPAGWDEEHPGAISRVAAVTLELRKASQAQGTVQS